MTRSKKSKKSELSPSTYSMYRRNRPAMIALIVFLLIGVILAFVNIFRDCGLFGGTNSKLIKFLVWIFAWPVGLFCWAGKACKENGLLEHRNPMEAQMSSGRSYNPDIKDNVLRYVASCARQQ